MEVKIRYDGEKHLPGRECFPVGESELAKFRLSGESLRNLHRRVIVRLYWRYLLPKVRRCTTFMISLSGYGRILLQSPEGVPHRLHGTLVVAFATVATRRRSSQATGALVVAVATVMPIQRIRKLFKRSIHKTNTLFSPSPHNFNISNCIRCHSDTISETLPCNAREYIFLTCKPMLI